MGWNPIKDIKKAVSNVSKEVSKGVNNVVKETSKGVSNVVKETGKGVKLTGQIISSADDMIGGDVGKVVGLVTNPFGAQVSATGSLVKGDIKEAANFMGGSIANQTFGAATVSSTVKKSLQGNTLKSVTFGMTDDWVLASESGKSMGLTGQATSEDWKNLTQAGVKTAVAAGAIYGAGAAVNAYGGAKAVGASVASGAGSIVGGAVKGTTTAAVAATVKKGLQNVTHGGTKASEDPSVIGPKSSNSTSGGAIAIGAILAIVIGLII